MKILRSKVISDSYSFFCELIFINQQKTKKEKDLIKSLGHAAWSFKRGLEWNEDSRGQFPGSGMEWKGLATEGRQYITW